MAKLLSEKTFNEMKQSIEVTKRLSPRTRGVQRVRVRGASGGGGGSRAYVEITSVIDAENYIGDLLEGPSGGIVDTGVSIVIEGAVTNAAEAGDSGFADEVDGVYYLQGAVLI